MRQRAIFFLILLTLANKTFCQVSKDSTWSSFLDQVVVTAQFTPTETRETVNSVRVLNRKTIEQRGVLNLQELLQAEPNLRISQDPILGSELSINGLKGENLKILIDGVPVVGRLNGNVDAGQIPLSSIQKVEIIEGAQSLLYGSEASGGVINLITKKSQLHTVNAEIHGQFENNGFRNLSVMAGFAKRGWTGQLTGNIQDFVPQPDTSMGRDQTWNPKRQQSARAMVRFQPNTKTDVRMTANVLTETVDNLGDIRRPVFKPYAFDDYYLTERWDIQLYSDRWTDNRDLIQTTLGWNHFGRTKRSYRYDVDTDQNTLLPGLQDTSSAEGVMARLTYARDRAGKPVSFIVGLENYFELATGTRLYDSLSPIPNRAMTNDVGLFASGKVKYQNWVGQAGARYTQNLRYGSALVPSAWLKWQSSLPLQARFSWAYGFRSPSVKELFFSFIDINHYVIGNANLQPEKSVNLRAELTYEAVRTSPFQFTVIASGFYNQVNDRIILTALGPVHYEYRNVEKWNTTGGNVRLQFSWNEFIRIQSDVTYTGFHNAMPDVIQADYLWSPDVTNEMNISWGEGIWNWNIWHKRTGRTPYFYNQDGRTLQGLNDAWNMLNTSLTVRLFKQKVRLNAGVKNILNVRQLQANNANGIHIEASNQQNLHWGRTFFTGITWTI